jgi:hypothetical protein
MMDPVVDNATAPATAGGEVVRELQLALHSVAEGDLDQAHEMVERHDQQLRAIAGRLDAASLLAVQAAQQELIAGLVVARQACGDAMRRLDAGRTAVECYAVQHAMRAYNE